MASRVHNQPLGPENRIRTRIARLAMLIGSFFLVIGVSAPSFKPLQAALLPYQALVSNGSVILEPGQDKLITLKFKNVGTKTWKSGRSAAAVYLYGDSSIFAHPSWLDDDLPAVIREASVKTGAMASATFYVRAPKTPGTYTEKFLLSYGPNQWVKDSTVPVTFTVAKAGSLGSAAVPSTPVAASPSAPAPSSNGSYNTVLLLTSHKEVKLSGNDRLQLTQGFKNAGTAVWNSRTLQLVGVTPSLGTLSNVHDESWPTTTEPVKATDVTPPGQIGFVTYTIKAPVKKGDYMASFKLMADGQEVEGGLIDIPITVTADGVISPDPIAVPGQLVGQEPLPLNGDASVLPDEPIMRAGLYRTTDDTLMARGLNGGMVATHNGVTVCTFKLGEIATVVYQRATRLYVLSGPGCTAQSTGWYVLAADDGISPLEITDYSRPIAWLAGSNDNKFRAKLELRHSPATDAVWVINELPFEAYLKGIAETSDVSPLEYQKALLTAARTYGLYHINRGTKHATEYFHVDSHLDQVYRGYGQEARSPNIVEGVLKTRGQIVTYAEKLAITPYYSRSDGRTRDWTEVWGGSGYAWLKSVPVPHDVGQTLWGHGVGMSARGALYMASKDGATYDTILKHFYVGTELRKAYK